ncbi:MAG: hypothetical protein AAGF93_17305 [Cyanobacteria bacterium P01_H01_bin.105]
MTTDTLQYLANLAQVISFPIACLALILQIASWLIPSPLAFRLSPSFQRLRSILPYVVVAASSFWLGSRYFSSPNQTNQSIWIALIVAAILVIVIVNSSRSSSDKPNSMVRVQRQALIDTGIRLMYDTKREVIMFGSDMSWANDYEEAVRSITSQGKKVIVLYESNSATGVRRNAGVLRDAGATLVATSSDIGVRGMLIDPYEREDALLYTAYRRLKRGRSLDIKEGDKSSSKSHEYYAKIYNTESDSLVIKAVTKYAEILQSKKV